MPAHKKYFLLHILLIALCTSTPGLAAKKNQINVTSTTESIALNPIIFEAIDTESSWSLQTAQTADFSPAFNKYHFGVTTGTIWLRANLYNATNELKEMHLELDNAIINSFKVYESSPHPRKIQASGSDVAFNQRPYPFRNPAILLKLSPKTTTSILIAVSSKNSLNLPLYLKSKAIINQDHILAGRIFGFYFGAIFIIATLSLLMFFLQKNAAYLYYLGVLTFLHLGLIPYTFGIGQSYLLPNTFGAGGYITSFGQMGTMVFFTLFSRRLLFGEATQGIFKTVMIIVASVSIFLSMKIMVSGTSLTHLYILPPTAAIIILSQIYIAFIGIRKGYVASGLYLFSWLGTFLGAIVFLCSIFGLAGINEARITLMIGSIFQAFILLIAMAQKVRGIEQERITAKENIQRLKNSLTRLMPTHIIEKIIKNPGMLSRPPTTQTITIMFVDMVSFSKVTENKNAEEVFQSTKKSLNYLYDIIRKHNGFIDRSLGDGVLCFFGYSEFNSNPVSHYHDAIVCALEIQRLSVSHLLKKPQEVLGFAYRIGINTDIVSIGNMGDETTPDFTVAGQGVVLASRLEASCDPFMISIGKGTYNLLSKSELYNPRKRWIHIKHDEKLIPSYEINPFLEENDTLKKARMIFYQQISVKMHHERFEAKDGRIKAIIGGITCNLSNYSYTGFGVTGPKYWGRHLLLPATIFSSDPEQNDYIKSFHLDDIKVSIRWGTIIHPLKYRHGIELYSLSDKQMQVLFTLCQREWSNKKGASTSTP